MTQQGLVEPEVKEILKADDLLTRMYGGPEFHAGLNLFVAYFRSTQTGQAPHSPKNCLPGAGWMPSESNTIAILVAGEVHPIPVNRYLVSKGDDKSVVLYWYQSHNRVVASEYTARFWLVADSIRYHRSDTALVRIVANVFDNNEQKSTDAAVKFAQASFPVLRAFLPD
jgi:EpsI family protein